MLPNQIRAQLGKRPTSIGQAHLTGGLLRQATDGGLLLGGQTNRPTELGGLLYTSQPR